LVSGLVVHPPVISYMRMFPDLLPRPFVFVGIGLGLAIGILTLTYLVSRLASGRLRHVLQRGGLQVNAAILVSRTAWVGIWAIGIVLVLYLFGLGLTPLAAFIGVIGLAASLSLQAVLQNLVAGIYLLAEKPFAIGDVITVVAANGVNHEGTVEDIQLRTTHLRSQDDELILVPNAAVFTGVVTNRTAVGGYVLRLTMTFPRSMSADPAIAQVLSALQSVSSILTSPRAQVRVDKMTKEDWTATVLFWSGQSDADSHAVRMLGEAFPDATVEASTVT